MDQGYIVYGLVYAKDLANKENKPTAISVTGNNIRVLHGTNLFGDISSEVRDVQAEGTVGVGKRKADQTVSAAKRQNTGNFR